ncbi:MAG: NAD(P)-dependent oxidoreductase, partial [Cytophagales bacterium]|nr:NAD(P)-dependent oxidoreductase [Cytophagales bacterium]
MKILITGSNGLLGQKLVRLILGHPEIELIATSRGENRLPFAGSYVYQPMNITQKDEVENTLKAYAPDVVINTAAMTHVDQCEAEQEACWKLNVEAVDYLVQACEKQDIFLLHLSTDFIFDGQAGPYDEKAAPNPISFYGESKLAAEKLIRSSSARWAIARTVLVYGLAHDMSRSNIVLWVKNSLEQGKELRIVNDQWRTPTLAEDLAQGCFLIARQQAGGIFNLSGEELMTPYDMAML